MRRDLHKQLTTNHHRMISLQHPDRFEQRHIGVSAADLEAMLSTIGVSSLEQLIDETVPAAIRLPRPLQLPEALSEYDYLQMLKGIAARNRQFKSYIGLGYYGTITPSVIARNIFQNPGWYTQYTPYQAEIAQGRLEALLNYQTMVSDLTGLPIANASLLDEGTAAAEAMSMFFHLKNKGSEPTARQFIVSKNIFPQTLDVLITRAKPLGIEVVPEDADNVTLNEHAFGIFLQYPADNGAVENYSQLVQRAKEQGIYVVVAADLLSLALLTPPGEWGADAVVGNSQRFGVPMGLGGPHAAFFATKDDYKRSMPGRIIGVSIDANGKRALRMALQTREQHIRRDKATSNICTAQALLAIMAGMYAAYHGPKGIRGIAERVHGLAQVLAGELKKLGYTQLNAAYFDTLNIDATDEVGQQNIRAAALAAGINLRYVYKRYVQVTIDETTNLQDIVALIRVFAQARNIDATIVSAPYLAETYTQLSVNVPQALQRQSPYLQHEVFNKYHSESEMMRYIKRLENKDLSLTHSMISLGSCTMKLNAATELMPVSWDAFANIHPFVPANQIEGYQQIFSELEAYLCEITGFTGCSLQPNSGAQGEYAGLMTIRAYHASRGDHHRNVALIPSSAHGTNPASAVMVAMKVVVVKCDERGNIDVADLRAKAEQYSNELSCLMVTYPSTHGVFETSIREICDIIHQHGGLVYMDGANMNAQVGLTAPGFIGADVCHLNLHKTFAIPHGGGGPGMGPICVNDKLRPFLPTHVFAKVGGEQGVNAVSAAPWGSASILLISYAYIRMLGGEGCRRATEYAILNANYIKARLQGAYSVLYTGENGRSAHELIVDLRHLKKLGLAAEDVAKRLMDYGFHAPTLSFPVADTIMIEPTESESKAELDRFCDALLQIRREIEEVVTGEADVKNNVLVNAPHTADIVVSDNWTRPYSREKAAYPLPFVRSQKFWASVSRIDGAYGDKNLICTCPPMEVYETEAVGH